MASYCIEADVTVASGRTKLIDASVPGINLAAMVMSAAAADPTWEIYVDRNISTLAPMTNPSFVAATTGGTIPRSTVLYCRLAAVDAPGLESPPSDSSTFKSTAATTDTNKVTISWGAMTGASSYNLYLGTRPGMEGFFQNVVGTSLIVTDLSTMVDIALALTSVPDFKISGKKLGIDSIPISGPGIQVSNRIIVYVNTSAGSAVYFNAVGS